MLLTLNHDVRAEYQRRYIRQQSVSLSRSVNLSGFPLSISFGHLGALIIDVAYLSVLGLTYSLWLSAQPGDM